MIVSAWLKESVECSTGSLDSSFSHLDVVLANELSEETKKIHIFVVQKKPKSLSSVMTSGLSGNRTYVLIRNLLVEID
jgi:hypothetical protein